MTQASKSLHIFVEFPDAIHTSLQIFLTQNLNHAKHFPYVYVTLCMGQFKWVVALSNKH